MVRLHLCGFILGFLLDLIIGDPHWFLIHPVRIMGKLISALDRAFLGPQTEGRHKSFESGKTDLREYVQGIFTILLTVLLSVLATAVLLYICLQVSRYLFVAAEAFLTCTCLSTASLIRETTPVKKAIDSGDIITARKKLSYVVGRDTQNLTKTEIIKAVIETLAENMSDGIISPLFWLAIFGPCGGMAFKAISTGDSMIGYKSERYYSFGRAAAKLDDVLNYIPARISAFLIMLVSILSKNLSAHSSYETYKRDHMKTSSPNAGSPESAMAGALGIRLGGPAYYGGVLIDRPTLGSTISELRIDKGLISLTQKIVAACSVVMEIICVVVLYLLL